MTMLDGRIGRFVAAARKLLLMQAAVAVLAAALSVWAVFAVRDLAAERDQLQAKVAALESQRTAPAPAAASPAMEAPDPNMIAPAASIIVPVPIPVPVTDPLAPVLPLPDAEAPAAGPGAVTPAPELDCSGANANQPRCRPGRWNRRDPPVQRPAPPATDPERGGNQQQPQLN